METNWGYGDGGSDDAWEAFAEETVSDKDLIEEVKLDIDDFFEKYKKSLILRYNLLKR